MTSNLSVDLDSADEIDDLLEFSKELEGTVDTSPDQEDDLQASQEPQEDLDAKAKVRALLEGLGLPGAQLDAIKSKYGGLYTFYPSNEDLYVFRPLMKNEWDLLQQKLSDKQTKQVDQQKLEMAVVSRCTVYPKLKDAESVDTRRAGLVPTLFTAVMHASYFMNPQMSLSLVVEL